MPISITVALQLLAHALHQPKVSDHGECTSPDFFVWLLSPTADIASTSAAAAWSSAGLLLAEGKSKQVQEYWLPANSPLGGRPYKKGQHQ